jgi:precorrin-6B methylase 2
VRGQPTSIGAPGFFNGSRIFIPHAGSGFAGSGGFFISPSFYRHRVPLAVLGVSPFYRRSNWYLSRYPSGVLFDSPYYAVPSLPVPFVPSDGWVDPYQIAPAPADARVRNPGQWAPYDPTPAEVVERMLALAGVKNGDVVYDLGSGDGRIVIAAAKKYGVKAVGFEIDPGLVKLARENVRKQGVEKLVEIRQQDFTTANLSGATVVALYLSYDGNQALRRQLEHQLKPGARIVSYTFDMGDWPAKIIESYRDAGGDLHMVYLWQIAEPAVYGENTLAVPAP